jgi:hypothetical protein
MQINYANLTDGERELVHWQYNLQGSFMSALFAAIAHADTGNRIRLWKGFPEYVEAYVQFAEKPGYWPDVQRRAGLLAPDAKATEAEQAEGRG